MSWRIPDEAPWETVKPQEGNPPAEGGQENEPDHPEDKP